MPNNTLARTSRLEHPSGAVLETPILIPSFSSKGFGFQTKRTASGISECSEVEDIFKAASEFLTDSMLVSAFDIYHGYLPKPEHALTEITFVDSGGYETSDQQDLSSTFTHYVSRGEWDARKHEDVLLSWPEQVPAVFISFDTSDLRVPLAAQIENGQTLFRAHRSHLSALLVKPETADQRYVQVTNVIASARDFRVFDVVGFTEKELGNSTLQRMEKLAQIRLALDDAGVQKPIHVFGSLDPLSVPLYFMAGAEIFDGLTWLRYGYTADAAIYRQNYAAKHIGIDRRDDFIKLKAMQDNLGYLRTLTNHMRRFLNDGDFTKFGGNAEIIREGVELLRTRVRRI
jgi:hypothetical protein